MTRNSIAVGCLALVAILAAPAAATSPRSQCPVTRAEGRASFDLGHRALRVAIHWPGGTLPAGELPGGGSHAVVDEDGSIDLKLGWWRRQGELAISGLRLDGDAPPLRADVPCCYAAPGFQVSGLTFPTTGCWRVVGQAGTARLAFVVRVVRS